MIASIRGSAQLTVVEGAAMAMTPEQLVANWLIGEGIAISNVTYNGSTAQITSNQIGTFIATGPALNQLDIESGILMTSGQASLAIGPNTGNTGTNTNGGGDPDLTAIAGTATFDKCVLEFDFVPESDTIEFSYVFGSEEFYDYCASINDAFGFFLSGPGISGPYSNNSVNIALLPGGTLPVTINNMCNDQSTNWCNQPNGNGFQNCPEVQGVNLQYDGFSYVLTAWHTVIPCSTYHIKLAIGDAVDHILDSGVFLEKNSFSSVGITVNTSFSVPSLGERAIEGCSNALITVVSPEPLAQPYTFYFTISGTAQNGIDYTLIPDSITILAGQTSASLTIQPIYDGMVEGTETVILTFTQTTCSSTQTLADTILIDDNTPFFVNAGLDDTICLGQTATLTGTAWGGQRPFEYTWQGTTGHDSIIQVSPPSPGNYQYILAVEEGCSVIDRDTVILLVNPLPVPSFTTGVSSACLGVPANVYATDPGKLNYIWTIPNPEATINSGGSLADDSVTLTWNTDGTFPVKVNYTEPSTGCSGANNTIFNVTVHPLPTASISGTTSLCKGRPAPAITFAGASGAEPYTFYYQINGGPPQSITTTSGSSVSVSQSTTTAGIYVYSLVSVTDNNTCSQTQTGTATITVHPWPTATISGTTAVCKNDPPPLITFTGATGTPPYTFEYSIDGGPTLSISTTSGNSVSISQSTGTPGSFVYTLTNVMDANTCSQPQSGSVTIVVNPLPTAAINGTTSVCQNSSDPGITFTGATGQAPYTFHYMINGGLSQSVTTISGSSVTVNQSTSIPGTYVYSLVSVTDGNTCSQAQTGASTITVNPLPVPDINGPAIACVNTPGPVYYTDDGMAGYTWIVSGGSFTQGITADTIHVTWTTVGLNSVSVSYTDLNGCTSAVPSVYTVNVALLPEPSITTPPANTCIDQVTTFITQSGMSGYTWNVSPDGTFTGGGTEQIDVTWTTPGLKQVTVNYQMGPGCTGAAPGSATVMVHPRPQVINAITTESICSATSTSFVLLSDLPGSTFAWSAFASSDSVTGFSNAMGNTIDQTLVNTGYLKHMVTYRTAATANNCTGDSTDFIVTVFPVPDVIITPPEKAICSGQTTGLTLQSHVADASFEWTATGSSPNISGYGPGTGHTIEQTLINSGYLMPWATYQVAPAANGCPGTTDRVIVTVNPLPAAAIPVCFDTLTTTQARPYILKGAVPLGGIFTGAGVTGSTFYPAVAGAGIHTLRYIYINEFGCRDSSSINIKVMDPLPHTCGNPFTDIRDNQSYATALIGGQCWMAANLNYGNAVPSSQVQRDNCMNEKYCFNDNTGNCETYGGLYQWEEVMRYTPDNGAQGLCPAGWHVPAEAEWNTLFQSYISNGFAGSALKYSGFSGFNALLEGIRFHNSIWRFQGPSSVLNSTLFWSSSLAGPDKAWAHGINDVVTDREYTQSVSLYPALKSNVFLVRCIKD